MEYQNPSSQLSELPVSTNAEEIRALVNNFGNEIDPSTLVKIAEECSNLFFEVLSEKNNDKMEEETQQEEDEFKDNLIFVPKSIPYISLILDIIKTNAFQEAKETFEELLLPIIDFCLSDEGVEYVEFGLNFVLEILSKSAIISESMWSIYPQLNYILAGCAEPEGSKPYDGPPTDTFKKMIWDMENSRKKLFIIGHAVDYIHLVIPSLQIYIQKGKDIIFTEKDPLFNLSYAELALRTVDRVKLKKSIDVAVSHGIDFALLENYPNQIDELLTRILENRVNDLLNSKDQSEQKSYLEVIAACLWNNPDLTLQFFEQKQLVERLFVFWFKIIPRFRQMNECLRVLMGWSSIFRGNIAHFSEVASNFLPQILQESIKLTTKILQLNNDFEEEDDIEEEGIPPGFGNAADYILKGNFGEDDSDGGEYDVRGQHYYHSLIENKCIILYLKETLATMQQNYSEAYNKVISVLNEEEKITLQNNFEAALSLQQENEKVDMQNIQEKLSEVHIKEE